MSQVVDVIVRRGGDEIDTLSKRPVRIMHSGHAGVVYGGVVHPLHKGNFIDVLEPSKPKESCLGYLEVGHVIPYAPFGKKQQPLVLTKWHVETNQFGNYLVFDGSEAAAETVATLMRSEGLGVRRWDRSWRPADDGYTYDWFVRLEYQGDHDDCVKRIKRALGLSRPAPATAGKKAPAIPEPRSSTENRTDAVLQQEMADARRKAAALESALANERAEAQAERARHKAVETEHRRQLDLAEARVRQLEAVNATLSDQARSANAQLEVLRKSEKRAREQLQGRADESSALAKERQSAAEWQALAEAYVRDAAQQTEAAAAAEALTRDKDRQIKDLTAQCDALGVRVNDLELDLKEAQRGRRASGRLSADALLGWMWPDLELDPDSLENLEDFPRPTAMLQALHKLAANQLPCHPVTGDGVKQCASLHEVDQKIATGDPDAGPMGRIYYRVLPDGRKLVLIHKKKNDKEQQRTWRRFIGRDLRAL